MELTLPDGSRKTSDALLEPWLKRRDAARKARRPFEGQWMTNQAFAAGRQWVVYMDRDHRVLDDPRPKLEGRSMETSDVLTQYLWTVIGKLAGDDFRPELLFQHEGEEGETFAQAANKAFGWGWEEEWHGDDQLLELLLTLVTFGTGGIRCRYDRSRGQMIGDVPHAPEGGHSYTDPQTGQQETFEAGKPILNPNAARAYVADRKYYGEQIDLRPLREGAVCWEVLSPWNLLPPPAVENANDFPWEIVVRPVALETLRSLYGDKAESVQEDGIEAMQILGMRDSGANITSGGMASKAMGQQAKLDDHALVYTGYEPPCPDYPNGLTTVWANDNMLLDARASLPYNDAPRGPRSGITYFHYWRVKQRFFGRALIEPGIGPQRTRNKRRSQQADLIDRGMPKVFAEEGALPDTEGTPMEIVELKPGSAVPVIQQGINPGPWMAQDIEQCDADIERALGLRGVALGQNPTGVTAYSAMALLTENDAAKLDPISKDLRLGIAQVSRDSLESMKQWPDGKQLLIVGDDERLEAITFQRSQVPTTYMVRPAKGGTLPRSQAAEVQKIADLAQYSLNSRMPLPLQWYKESLDAGKAQELPENLAHEQQRAAELENAVMVHTGQPAPVAPYDDANMHVPIHRRQQLELTAAAERGDQQAGMLAQAIELHVQQHLFQAQQNAQQNVSAGVAPVPPATPQRQAA